MNMLYLLYNENGLNFSSLNQISMQKKSFSIEFGMSDFELMKRVWWRTNGYNNEKKGIDFLHNAYDNNEFMCVRQNHRAGIVGHIDMMCSGHAMHIYAVVVALVGSQQLWIRPQLCHGQQNVDPHSNRLRAKFVVIFFNMPFGTCTICYCWTIDFLCVWVTAFTIIWTEKNDMSFQYFNYRKSFQHPPQTAA